MKIKQSVGETIFDVINVIILFIIMVVTLYPFLYVVFASVSDPVKVMQSGSILLWPKGFQLGAYGMVFKNEMIAVGYKNTLIYVVAGTALNILLTSFGAYALSRKDLYGRDLFTFIIVFTMFFNGGLIPTFLLVKSLNMVNTMWAMIIPGAISVWNLIIMRTSFQGIPDSLIESAKLDGANDFTILFKIVIPLSLPVVAVMILFYGVGHWNDFFNALIYLRDKSLYPIQLVLRDILIANSTDSMTTGVVLDTLPISENVKYATVVVSTVPILLIYPFIQKYFVKGVMIGAIKE
ncbi:putative aldouronate transport system permease protein [Caldanaerobius fijiensis DSM 17918]|uniref:Putative aldouronate transport system permease protein n=1 Tax=Caldanaerobius fijiensis DSM 17918 TaxID=1121256 RepID=A0A1M5CS36_9THEO|nr:carbohydrate ABC transporter permease [Caldanaerobius fijiensis]SHF57558.1 putative aldouronate transport system permease protein [Caldanaerobius fijiensis DSM 17918]